MLIITINIKLLKDKELTNYSKNNSFIYYFMIIFMIKFKLKRNILIN